MLTINSPPDHRPIRLKSSGYEIIHPQLQAHCASCCKPFPSTDNRLLSLCTNWCCDTNSRVCMDCMLMVFDHASSQDESYRCLGCRQCLLECAVAEVVIASGVQDAKVCCFIEKYVLKLVYNLYFCTFLSSEFFNNHLEASIRRFYSKDITRVVPKYQLQKEIKEPNSFDLSLIALLKISNLLLKHNYLAIWEGCICNRLLSVYKEHENYCSDTLLHMVSKEGYKEVLEKLLQLPLINLQVNTVDQYGYTPLHYAILKGDLDIVHLLIQSEKVNINYSDNSNNTYLHMAVLRNAFDIVELLIRSDRIKPNMRNKSKLRPLYLAISMGQLATVKLFIESDKVDLNIKDRNGHGPLHIAVSRKLYAIAKLLIGSHKIDPNQVDGCGYTPLHLAVLRGRFTISQLLIKCNAVDLNIQDRKGRTPLHITISKSNFSISKLLIESGKVDLHSKDNNGQTPLDIVASKDCLIRKLLLAKLKKSNNRHRPVSDFSSIIKLLYA